MPSRAPAGVDVRTALRGEPVPPRGARTTAARITRLNTGRRLRGSTSSRRNPESGGACRTSNRLRRLNRTVSASFACRSNCRREWDFSEKIARPDITSSASRNFRPDTLSSIHSNQAWASLRRPGLLGAVRKTVRLLAIAEPSSARFLKLQARDGECPGYRSPDVRADLLPAHVQCKQVEPPKTSSRKRARVYECHLASCSMTPVYAATLKLSGNR